MTCREKLKELYPGWTKDDLNDAVLYDCPVDHMDICIPRDDNGRGWCGFNRCDKCWDREVPNTESFTYKHVGKPIGTVTELTMNDNGVTATVALNNKKEKNMATKKTKAELEKELETIKESKAELEKELKNLEKYKQYEDMAGEVHAIYMSFVHAGFSEEQAYDLLKTMIQNAGNINFNVTAKPTYRDYYKR